MAKSKPKTVKLSMSSKKFIFLSFITLGMYQMYWAWKVWETMRNSEQATYGLKSSIRAFFLEFSSFWLFPRLRSLAVEHGYEKKVNVELLALAYLLFGFALCLLPPYVSIIIFTIISTLLLLPIVKMQNYYTEATEGKFLPTQKNWWLIAVLVIVGALDPIASYLALNTTEVTITNDTKDEVSIVNCGTIETSIKSLHQDTIDDLGKNDPHASCKVFSNKTGNYLGCLATPTTAQYVDAVFKASDAKKNVNENDCGQ